MRLNSKMRGAEKRAPAMSVLVTTAVFVAVFLVALWALSGPTGGSGYSSNMSKTISASSAREDTYQAKTTYPPKSQERVELSVEPESTDENRADETLPVTNNSVELLTESDNSEEESLAEFERSEEEMEGTDLDSPVEKGKLDELPDEVKGTNRQKTSTTDTAELSVEKDEATSSTLLTQGKESKEEKIQEVIQDTGAVDEEDIVDELEWKPIQESDTAEEKAATFGGLESVEVTNEGKYSWKLCTFAGAQDYIPCLDNKKAIKALKSTSHYQHYERRCPVGKELSTCLVPLPEGYQTRIDWPESRDKVWHANVPHDKLVSYKHDQNWVEKQDKYLVFPGGGTQFKTGALQYIDTIQKTCSNITWGKHIRTVLDVGCGVASFGGYMFEKDALVMSFAPKDEHEAQVQMALERGIPGMLSVMGTKRLTFPSNVFDVVHCARCRVPWHKDDGKLLLELNRVLRPGGYFVWSATPVYRTKDPKEIGLWDATKNVADGLCWDLLVRTKAAADTGIGMAIFQKPTDNSCYDKRKVDEPPMCAVDDKADAAWYVDMNSCIHRIPSGDGVRATSWPENWPARLETTPKWLSSVPKGVYGKLASEEFVSDNSHWQNIVTKSYFKALGIEWEHVRNVLDMKAGYGGFAAALSTQQVWVMNVVPTDEPDTLPIIYDRGLLGVYHDWCESFSTYPRTYDLLHANRVFASVDKRCSILTTLIEIDRILRPAGWAIFRDEQDTVDEIKEIVISLHWTVKYSYVEGSQRILAAQKGMWRPEAESN